MAELRQREGPITKSPGVESVSQVRAEFTSSWEAALRGVGIPPRIHPFLTRVAEADRSHLERELTEIDQEFCKRSGPASTWMEGTVDQKADTPGPECLATIDSVRQEESGMPSCDPAATLERVIQDSSASRPPDALGLPNAAFSLKEGGVAAEVPASIRKRAGQIIVPGYEIVGELGRGGMGVVYKARQIGLNRWVALKMVLAGAHASQHQLDRFLTEAKAVADLQHPNIVQIYDIDEHEGLPYFSLEFVGGGSLDTKVHRKAQPPREAAHMVETLAQAMQYAHEHGVIHRDLKPANILLTVDGMPKITDFGLAKRLEEESSQTKSGTLMGTPNYMAPEQARGEVQLVGPLADVYTLGAILYELLTGRPPFQGATILETVKQVTNDEPVPPSRLQRHVPRDLETICLKCLQKDMVKRYGSARLLADDLRRFLSDEPILARPVSNWERLARWCRRNPRVAALVGTVALLLIVVAVGSFAFAYRISQEMAETERQKKIADQNAVAEKLARQEADGNAEIAKQQEKIAKEQAGLAVNSLNEVVTKMEEELRDKAGLGPVRLAIVDMALAGLDKVQKSEETSGRVSRTTGVAYQRIGDVYYQLGQTEKFAQLYKQSADIFEKLAKQEPGNDWIPWNLGITYDKMATRSVEMEGNAEAALRHLSRALELCEGLVRTVQTPELKPPLRHIGVGVYNNKLAALSFDLGDPVRARHCARRGLQSGQAGLEMDPTIKLGPVVVADSYYHLGRASLHLAENEFARESYHQCRALRQKIVDAQPLNDSAKKGLGAIQDLIGDMELELGNAAAAREQYRPAHETYAKLLQKEEKNAEIKWYLANSYYRLGTVELLLAHKKTADQHFAESLRLRQDLEKSDPKNFQRQTELLLARARCGQNLPAAEIAQNLEKRAPRNPAILFSAACGYALCIPAVAQGQPASALSKDKQTLQSDYANKALAALRQAIAHGYKDSRALEICPDLEPLRSYDGYKQLLSQVAKP